MLDFIIILTPAEQKKIVGGFLGDRRCGKNENMICRDDADCPGDCICNGVCEDNNNFWNK